MAARVFLHIGTMKSATSYVQELGARNCGRLRRQGVHWITGDRPFVALIDLLDTAERRAGHEGTWLDLTREIADYPGIVVVSNERLAPLGGRRIRRVLAGMAPAEVDIVVTARDLGRVIPSHWQETLKNGDATPWATFSGAVCREPARDADVARKKDIGTWFWRRHDVAGIVNRWQRHAPACSVTLVTIPPRGSAPQLVSERFGSAIGVDTSGFEQPEPENSSVGAHSAELLRRLNEAAPQWERNHFRWGVKEALVGRSLASRATSEPRFGLSPEQHTWVRRRADRMIEEIEGSGVRVVGDLEDLRPAAGSTSGVDPGSASDAELLQAALHGLAGMVDVVGRLQLQRERALPQAVTGRAPIA